MIACYRTIRRWTVLTVIALAPVVAHMSAAEAQALRTRAERSDWLETSRYRDVMAFLDGIDESPLLHSGTFGYSLEGRPLPLVVAGPGLADGGPEAVLASDRTRVLLMANIHAGEVEGKEALQILLRRVADGEHRDWLDSLVVLIAPIYNVDGNERISVMNRARQNGPLGGVGTRANAQDLDLNRDHMKLASPEARSLVELLNAYDPHVVVDLHATNGTRHAYHLTYAPPLHPGTAPEIVGLLREEWLPEVTRSIGAEYGWGLYYYGNAYAPEGGERGWYTFDHRPRFNTNYLGLRNRFAILSEAYAYASFRERVWVTLAFVEEILDYAHRHATAIDRTAGRADRMDLRGRSLPVRARHQRGPEIEILMGAVEERLSPYSGRRFLARLDEAVPERLRDFGTFTATESAAVPDAYLVPPSLGGVLDLLRFHGVRTRTAAVETMAVERFVIDSVRVAEQKYQGEREREVFGAWVGDRVKLPEGTVVVPMDQPLARLAFLLLEPRSDDGVVAWNVLDEPPDAARTYPILRRPAARR